MDCAAWNRARPDIRATTAEARATATLPTIKERYGDGFSDLSCWRTFACTATQRKPRVSWSRWELRCTCMVSARLEKSSKEMLRLRPTGASRRAGPWGKSSAPCRRFKEAAHRESRLARVLRLLVQLDQHFGCTGRGHQEEIDARAVGSGTGLGINRRNAEVFLENSGRAVH